MPPARRPASTSQLPFESIYRHGYARVAVATPRVEVASPAFNVAHTLELAREAAAHRARVETFTGPHGRRGRTDRDRRRRCGAAAARRVRVL